MLDPCRTLANSAQSATTTITELFAAECFYQRFHNAVCFDGDETWLICCNPHDEADMRGGPIDECFVAGLIRELLGELGQNADAPTRIRIESHTFLHSVLELAREDARLRLGHNNVRQWPLTYDRARRRVRQLAEAA